MADGSNSEAIITGVPCGVEKHYHGIALWGSSFSRSYMGSIKYQWYFGGCYYNA